MAQGWEAVAAKMEMPHMDQKRQLPALPLPSHLQNRCNMRTDGKTTAAFDVWLDILLNFCLPAMRLTGADDGAGGGIDAFPVMASRSTLPGLLAHAHVSILAPVYTPAAPGAGQGRSEQEGWLAGWASRTSKGNCFLPAVGTALPLNSRAFIAWCQKPLAQGRGSRNSNRLAYS